MIADLYPDLTRGADAPPPLTTSKPRRGETKMSFQKRLRRRIGFDDANLSLGTHSEVEICDPTIVYLGRYDWPKESGIAWFDENGDLWLQRVQPDSVPSNLDEAQALLASLQDEYHVETFVLASDWNRIAEVW